MRIVIDNTKRIGSLGEIEVDGEKMGADCARAILANPDINAVITRAVFLANAQKVIDKFRRIGDLTDFGEAAFRRGFERGLQSQMKTERLR